MKKVLVVFSILLALASQTQAQTATQTFSSPEAAKAYLASIGWTSGPYTGAITVDYKPGDSVVFIRYTGGPYSAVSAQVDLTYRNAYGGAMEHLILSGSAVSYYGNWQHPGELAIPLKSFKSQYTQYMYYKANGYDIQSMAYWEPTFTWSIRLTFTDTVNLKGLVSAWTPVNVPMLGYQEAPLYVPTDPTPVPAVKVTGKKK